MRMMRSNPTTAGPLVKRVTKVDELISLSFFAKKNVFAKCLVATLGISNMSFYMKKAHLAAVL